MIITVENRFFSLRSAACFIIERGLIIGSVVASFLLLHGRAGTQIVSMGDVVARALVITFFCQGCMYLLDLYNFRLFQTWGEVLFALAIAIGFVCIGIGLLSYAIPKFGVTVRMYYLSILFASLALLLWRMLFEFYITRIAPKENILIVGTGDVARKVGKEVERNERLGFHLVGYVSAQQATGNPTAERRGEGPGRGQPDGADHREARREEGRRGDHGAARRVSRPGDAGAAGGRASRYWSGRFSSRRSPAGSRSTTWRLPFSSSTRGSGNRRRCWRCAGSSPCSPPP